MNLCHLIRKGDKTLNAYSFNNSKINRCLLWFIHEWSFSLQTWPNENKCIFSGPKLLQKITVIDIEKDVAMKIINVS